MEFPADIGQDPRSVAFAQMEKRRNVRVGKAKVQGCHLPLLPAGEG